MTREEILQKTDHTLLKQDAAWDQIRQVLDDAMAYDCASACIPPVYVKQAAEYVNGRLPICTVIGFPNGNMTTAVKVYETKDAVKNGASEIDMVLHVGDVKAGNYDRIRDEIQAVKEACDGRILKVIIETCLLEPEEIARLCRTVSEGNADFIKTSTGFSTAGATFENVKIMADNRPEGLKIKAAGGISDFADAEEFLELGADRLGCSRLVKIAKEN
ncbi:MAG: deoxyribose-phosphate aldolase [Erysipelotrichaceae bacterium]|nr:deoxyribose-phosphate aldolase [Erysipelotrichaceae bacterium]